MPRPSSRCFTSATGGSNQQLHNCSRRPTSSKVPCPVSTSGPIPLHLAESPLCTVRDLHRRASEGGGALPDEEILRLVRVHLPLVYGAATRLLPEHPEVVPKLVSAVFQTLV